MSGAFERLASGAARLRQDEPERRVSVVARVNVLPSFASCWLLPRLAEFQARCPDIDVRISTASRKVRYVENAFDIGVRSGGEEGAGLVSRALMSLSQFSRNYWYEESGQLSILVGCPQRFDFRKAASLRANPTVPFHVRCCQHRNPVTDIRGMALTPWSGRSCS